MKAEKVSSMLFESGFITNKKDSNYLKSNSGQQQLADAIFDAVGDVPPVFIA